MKTGEWLRESGNLGHQAIVMLCLSKQAGRVLSDPLYIAQQSVVSQAEHNYKQSAEIFAPQQTRKEKNKDEIFIYGINTKI